MNEPPDRMDDPLDGMAGGHRVNEATGRMDQVAAP